MKKKELSDERGRILDQFVTIEICVDMIISRHYFSDFDPFSKGVDFRFNVLGNYRFNWALKRELLQHILRSDNLDNSRLDELDRINSLRNIFAHRPFITNDNPQIPESEVFFSNPKYPFDRNRNVAAEIYKNEFYTLTPPILEWLYSLAKIKGEILP